jgi:adenylosuccinate synthase
MDKTGRNGLRVGDVLSANFNEKYNALKEKHLNILKHYDDLHLDLDAMEKEWFSAIEVLKTLTTVSSEYYINQQLQENKKVLAEGAQGTLLDIDFGTYPFVTSSNTITAGTCTGLGVAPNKVGNVLGIFKAYCTRVGSGPFPTELDDEVGEQMRQEGREFGSTTGRARRCGWIDLVALKYAIMINGVTHLALMKVDVLSIFDTIKACTHYKIDGKIVDTMPYDICDAEIEPVYEDLKGWNIDLTQLTDLNVAPVELTNYLDYLEEKLGVPIHIVSVGPDRAQTLFHHGTF